MSEPRIIFYATSSCPHCAEARDAIRACGETWQERDPTSDVQTMEELLYLTMGARVPVVVVGGRAMIGFDRECFERMLQWPPIEPEAPRVGSLAQLMGDEPLPEEVVRRRG